MGGESLILLRDVRIGQDLEFALAGGVAAADAAVQGYVLSLVVEAEDGVGVGLEEAGGGELGEEVGAHCEDIGAGNEVFQPDVALGFEDTADLGYGRGGRGGLEPAELVGRYGAVVCADAGGGDDGEAMDGWSHGCCGCCGHYVDG